MHARGHTMLELLVVLGIVGLLSGLVLPGVAEMRLRAQESETAVAVRDAIAAVDAHMRWIAREVDDGEVTLSALDTLVREVPDQTGDGVRDHVAVTSSLYWVTRIDPYGLKHTTAGDPMFRTGVGGDHGQTGIHFDGLFSDGTARVVVDFPGYRDLPPSTHVLHFWDYLL